MKTYLFAYGSAIFTSQGRNAWAARRAAAALLEISPKALKIARP